MNSLISRLSFLFFLFVLSVPAFGEKIVSDPARISIVRDSWGVPHIYAPTDAEVAYGLAWAQSEDRFLDVQYRVLAGKCMLGEWKGKEGAVSDYASRLFDLEGIVADRMDKDLSPAFLKVLKGYTQGLNDYAASHPDEILIPASFPVTENELLQSYMLSIALLAGLDKVLIRIYEGRAEWELEDFDARGSNGFAIHASRSEDGANYLVLNPHMPLDGPFSWHEAHLVSEEGWNMMGVTFPGSAVLTIGSNNLLGWTHTVNHPDLTDVYHLEIHPDDPDLYRFGSEWLRLEKKETKLRVRAVLGVKLQVKKEILHSVFGPVIRTEKGTFAIRTTVFQRIGACEQWYRMSKSQNFSQFREALGLQQIPSLNVLYADRSDTIMYLNNGLFPYRDPAFDWTSILDGTNPATLWEPDFHPLEDLPMVINPEQGFLFNTNNSPFKCVPFGPNPDPAAFDPTMGFRMFENNRSTRVREMVSGMGKIGLQDLKRIKYDIRMPDSIRFQVDLMAFWDLDENRYQDLAPAIRKLHQWNRSSAATNEDAALFLLAWENLYERLHLHDSEPPYGLRLPEHYYVEALSDAARTLEKQFGSLDVPLGALQRYIRGEKNYPLSGMPDVLAFMYALPQKKGARKAMIGDSFVGFIRFGKKETAFETVLPYGASANPESPHFSDQMDLMHMHQTKQMTFDRLSILQQAEAVYSPSPTGLWAGKD